MNDTFTYQQACDIAEDFMDLEGTGIILETEDITVACNVQHVVVAPAAFDEKAAFLKAYKQHGNVNDALISYAGDAYTVLILGLNSDTTQDDLIIVPIKLYTTAYGITYRYP